ncbi:Amino acid transporter transmembrane domain-containing protein [Entamoeba marina]
MKYKTSSIPTNIANFSWDMFRGFPIMTVAFCGHYNVLRFYSELSNRSTTKMGIIQVMATFIAFFTYVLVGVFGYLSRGNVLSGNVLVSYPYTDIPMLIACASFYSNKRRILESTTLVSLIVLIALSIEKIEIVLEYNGAIFGVLVVYIFPGLFCF